MSNINSEFYIIKGQNKLLNSDFATSYPKTCDGLKVHWRPDAGDLFEIFSKNTEYSITFNETVNIDFIRFYLIPTSNYSKFGTRMQYDSNNNTYWMPYLRLYYSINGTDWSIINNSNAISMSEWFSQYQTLYQPYIGEPNDWGWINNNISFFAIKLNSTIQTRYLKFSLNRTTTFLNDYKVCEIEAFELLKFSIKEFRYNTERSIIENGVNDFTIDCTADDLNFNIYNNISTRNEIFGKVNIDGTDYLYGNLIVDLTEINTVSRELTMTLLPYTMINYNRIIDYNTPVIAKRSDYYPYDIIDLLMLMANKPSYFISGTGILSPVIFIPQHNENIITNLTNFLEANRQAVVYRDCKDNWGFASRGYDTQSTYTKTNPQYIELPAGMSESNNPIIQFSQDFLDINFWKEFFSQRIYIDYSKVGLTRTEQKIITHRKTKRVLIFKTVKKNIEIINEVIPIEKEGDLISVKDIQSLLDYFPVKNANSPYDANAWMMETSVITATAMSVPYENNPNNLMNIIFKFKIPAYTETLATRLEKMEFEYEDVRGQIKFDLQFGKEFFGNGSYVYPDIGYNYNATDYDRYLLIRIFSVYNSTWVYPFISIITVRKSDGAIVNSISKDYNPTLPGNIRFSQMFGINITGYTQAFGTVRIYAKKGLGTYFIDNLRVSGVYFSGIARKYLVSSFPAYDALNIDIKDWPGFVITNKQLINNIEAKVLYKTGENYNPLSVNEYTLNKITYPVNTSNVYFAYILKNVYPYTSGGKLWEIASINETIQFNTTTPSSYIEKYCKNLNYSKTTNLTDKEFLVSLLKIYQKDINNALENYSKDVCLQNTNDIITDTIEGFLLNKDYVYAYLTTQDLSGNSLYYLIPDGQEHIINDSKNYFKYLLYVDNFKIYYYIQNLKSSSPLSLVGKLNIDFFKTIFDDIEIINNYTSLQKQYGVIEYEANSMQTFTASQIYFIKTFFDWYNQSPVFTMKDIVIDGDMGLNLNNSFIKVIDRYLDKKIWIYPNRIEHYITEDLFFETSIQGKIIGEEAV